MQGLNNAFGARSDDRLPWFFVCMRCSSQSLQAPCPVQRYEKTWELEVSCSESNRENTPLNMEKYLPILMAVNSGNVSRYCTMHILCYSAFVFLLGQKIEYFFAWQCWKKPRKNTLKIALVFCVNLSIFKMCLFPEIKSIIKEEKSLVKNKSMGVFNDTLLLLTETQPLILGTCNLHEMMLVGST